MACLFARNRVAVLLPLFSLLACGDDSTSPPNPEPDHVTRESVNATSGVVGPAGGTLQTTANDGTVYTLTIPANAIATGKTITMTPVTAIDGYPLASGIVGGVELKPSGTVFTVPVTLVIETTQSPGAGLRVAGAGHLPVCRTALLRFFRLYGHGTRRRPVFWDSSDPELQQPICGAIHRGILATLAHVLFALDF